MRPRRSAVALVTTALVAGVLASVVPSAPAAAAETPGDSYIRQDNTFYAYVGAGENLDVQFLKSASLAGASPITVTVRGPGGITQSCTKQTTDAPNTACTFANLTSATPGVWAITFDVSVSTADYYLWTINVQRGTTTIPGRVYSERYTMFQGATLAASTDMSLWYQSELGYTYRADYTDYNGVDSVIYADATGIRYNGTCTSAYASIDGADTTRSSAGFRECGDPYKIFFEAPAADLPATATLFNGQTDWLKPAVAPTPSITNVSFTPDDARTRAGEIEFDVENFTGQLVVEIDTDDDGTYDVRLPGSAIDGSGAVRFDGRDADGNPVPAGQDMAVRVSIAQTGEIHFTQTDVEVRGGGVQVTRLNGVGAGDRTLRWNDSGLSTAGTCGTRPNPLDARTGVNSTGGVHSWTPAGCASLNGWGDVRVIDDWTSVPVDESAAVEVPGTQFDFGDAPASFGTTGANGASHVIGAGLTIGTELDAEADGQPTAGADGDDTTGIDDEDAFSTPVVLNPGATAAEITVPVTNSTGTTATLYGWIDANGDGVFQASESATVAVPDGATSVQLAFSGLSALVDGSTPVLRLRLTTDALADDTATPVDERSRVGASDGEVEDHLAQVATLVPISCVEPFVETFGTGTGYGAPLPAGQTTYIYEGRQPGQDGVVQDGEYGLPSSLPGTFGSWWHTGLDHTDDTDGRMMLINASLDEGIFFQRTFTQLVPGADYDFSAWITNANNAGSPTLPNVAFRVVDPATDTVLAEGETGDISNEPSLVWERYGLQFEATQSTVRLEVANNGPGGNGNDLAIDDVGFSPVCEFGDAPDSYGTTIASNGAGHIASGPTLGTERDTEADGQPTGDADGDDAAGTDDEDGISGPIEITVDEPASVTVSATNDSDSEATLAGWIDLDGNGVFDPAERVIVTVPANSGTADYTLTFPPGSTTADTYARFRLYAEPVADPQPTGTAAGGEVEDYPVTVLEPDLDVEKTSNMTADSRPGDVIRYTVTATNAGTGDYTDRNPAVVLDSLAGVLDDADYDGNAAAVISDGSDASAPVFIAPSFLSWSGALAAGETVSITYTVTLTPGGDGALRNVAWQPVTPPDPGVPPTQVPECEPRTADGTDPVTGEACAVVENELPKLTIAKASDVTELPADGGEVTYTVTVTNQGPGVYTEGAPASMEDDLPDVLDDASFGEILAPADGAVFNEDAEQVTWSGPLGVGESIVISYTVVYDADAEDGDHLLLNTACVPEAEAVDPAANCSSVQVPAAALVIGKTVDPADGTAVDQGESVTYTLTFQNTGRVPAAVDHLDDLSDVLDDAALTGTPSADAGLTAVLTGDELAITGSVPVGRTLTVTYTVLVDAYADQANHVLGNVLSLGDRTCPPLGCPGTENPIRHVAVTKTADPVTEVATGDTVTYIVTVTNDGAADYTAEIPAGMVDDMTDVLDDAGYNGDAEAIASDGSAVPAPTFSSPVLRWSGPVAVGETVTITYTVTVTNRGDHDLVNAASPVCADGVICDPPLPPVEILLPHVTPAKASDPESGAGVAAGDVVTYTLSWTNDGRAPGTVDSTDGLSGVLDDADLTSTPVVDGAHAGAVSAVFDPASQSIRVTGTIGAGETVTVTYAVTIRADGDRGDNQARNVLSPDVPPYLCLEDEAGCDPFEPPTTTHPIGELDDWKTVDPASGGTVRAGQEVTYTLHFENIGEAPVDVDREDVLTQVLDDATVTTAPVPSDDALAVSEIAGGRFAVTGTLAAGQIVTVSYTVTVKEDGARGDDRLGNVLVDAGEEPPTECAPADGERADCTVNHVSNVVPWKSSDPESGTAIAQGATVTYTLTFDNVSTNEDAADAAIDYTDHMADVLDDATLTRQPESSSDAVSATVEGDTIRVVGAIPSGETVTVTYAVTVAAYDRQGDHVLGNVIAVTGEEPICAEGSGLCTSHESPTPPPLAVTGGDVVWTSLLAALTFVLLGTAVFLVTRRRTSGAPAPEAPRVE
ncbi:DUF11 domain-containing protein [Labedella phragmitis]|uniref:DUF11 domain-containing protein n=1 Tax=Labedella phragmitis TaxID=2498849 RepID=A0A3S3Z696_9MICO|nr:GEVED domain-containing protein [Labedella phragmitis]RWZ52767.1 DUF11 domain-containing protein [Labedella phragmitis]